MFNKQIVSIVPNIFIFYPFLSLFKIVHDPVDAVAIDDLTMYSTKECFLERHMGSPASLNASSIRCCSSNWSKVKIKWSP